jgi:hypothetical protein
MSGVHPSRARVLRITVHERIPQSTNTATHSEILREFVSYLRESDDGMVDTDLQHFCTVSREWAGHLCSRVARFELVMHTIQMSDEAATGLSKAWLFEFDQSAVFFVNGQHMLGDIEALYTGFVPGLFQKDLEAGIIGVSQRRVGIFWNAEDS